MIVHVYKQVGGSPFWRNGLQFGRTRLAAPLYFFVSFDTGREEGEERQYCVFSTFCDLFCQICDVDNDGLLNDQELNDFQVQNVFSRAWFLTLFCRVGTKVHETCYTYMYMYEWYVGGYCLLHLLWWQ